MLLALLCGAMPLAISGWCDPRTGAFDFYRDDDGWGYDDGWYDDGLWIEVPLLPSLGIYYDDDCLLCW